jgi:YidC/Oxa1 family membrane protein insertase
MAILLACTYALVASYGLSIIVLSAAVTALTTPLACWAWRSQMRRAHLEPKLAELRRRHHNDRRRLASETAAVFKENGVSPWAGLLPSLLPAPIYLSVYEVIRGLTHRTRGSGLFSPRFLPHSSRLFHALASSATMRFWGIDLARTGAAALQLSGLSAGIFLGLVAITVGAGMYQQRLVRSALPRPSDPSKAPHRTLLFLPALFAIWGLAVPLGVTLYYASSSTVRVVQQWMIVRGHL